MSKTDMEQNITWVQADKLAKSLLYPHANLDKHIRLGLGLWCLTPLSTIFQLYPGCQFYWWRTPEDPEKTTDLSQVTDKLLSHNVVSSTPRLSGIRTQNVSGDRHRLNR